jgi:DNA-binding transcriptional MerR regulator
VAKRKARKKTTRSDASGGGYRIGTVANLTGLDPHTIRAWERRYRAIEPDRSAGGTRFYSDADVERLQLVKAVTDCGDPISRVAQLSDKALRARLAKLAKLPSAAPDAARLAVEQRVVRAALLEPGLAEQLRMNAAAAARVEFVVEETDPSDFVRAIAGRRVDVLLLGLDRMGPEPHAVLDRSMSASSARLAIVIYGFARRHDLAKLADRGAKLVRGPLSAPQIQRVIFDLLVIEEAKRRSAPGRAPLAAEPGRAAKAPPRRFSDKQLARLREISTSVDCECPNHIASLIESLLAFERYSHECESRDDVHAALHRRLARGTAQARAVVERMLVEVCEHDRIHL